MSLCNVITLFPRGTEEYLNCKGRVDIINSTLGKALGGAAGSVNTVFNKTVRAQQFISFYMQLFLSLQTFFVTWIYVFWLVCMDLIARWQHSSQN